MVRDQSVSFFHAFLRALAVFRVVYGFKFVKFVGLSFYGNVVLGRLGRLDDGKDIAMNFDLSTQNSRLNFKNNVPEPVNVQIRSHETQIEDWDLGKTAQEIYSWYDLFNKEFFTSKLGVAVLSFDPGRVSTLGHYVPGRNGIGIEHNINLNSRHLDRPKWQLLRILLHEMLHQYQVFFKEDDCKRSHNNYHKKSFRTKAESLGIPCDSRGESINPPTDPFVAFIKQHGVNVELENITHESLDMGVKGNSKLKKFSCQCTPPINVRVADIRRFSAKCDHCGQNFDAADGGHRKVQR